MNLIVCKNNDIYMKYEATFAKKKEQLIDI